MAFRPPDTFTEYDDVEVERHTNAATLFIIEGVKYWVPKSVYKDGYDDNCLTLPDWFELKPADSPRQTARPGRPSNHAPDQMGHCPHCDHPLRLLTNWIKKGSPVAGMAGACKSCGGFFKAVPRTLFTVSVYDPPSDMKQRLEEPTPPTAKPIEPVKANPLKKPSRPKPSIPENEDLRDGMPF